MYKARPVGRQCAYRDRCCDLVLTLHQGRRPDHSGFVGRLETRGEGVVT